LRLEFSNATSRVNRQNRLLEQFRSGLVPARSNRLLFSEKSRHAAGISQPDEMTDPSSSAEQSRTARLIPFVFGIQIIALTAAGWINRQALNPDGVAYMRIASYYASGKIDLAISGYWGPLLSWLLVPWLKAGVTMEVAARIVMALSAVYFLWACWRVFVGFGLRGKPLHWALWSVAVVAVFWSVENITPDLLLGALVGHAFSGMTMARWHSRPAAAWQSGLLWGLAYLAKGVAFPVALVICAGMGALWWSARPGSRAHLTRCLLFTLLGFSLLAAPWVAILSTKYGQFTFSTSGRLNHAMVGPSDVQRFYPLDRGFHRPEPGRVTFWEDPQVPYPDWSPFASVENALHQLRIVARNGCFVLIMLTSVSLAFPVMVGRALRRLRHREWRVRLSQGNWWWAGLPVTALALVYLPGNLLITEQRYFYPALPCLIVLHVGILFWWTTTVRPWIQQLGVVLVACAVIVPTLARGWLRPGPARAAGVQAHFLARKISEARLAGPIVGSGSLSGGRTGLYVAFLLDQPWYGDEPHPSAAGFKRSGARLIIVRRNNPVVEELDADPELRSLATILFASPEQARASPLKVYELVRWHVAIQNRFGFDLHQDFRRDQPFDFDHARRRPDVLEALSVGAANLLPFINVDHVDPRSDDVLQ
jgi:hypothetical protein